MGLISRFRAVKTRRAERKTAQKGAWDRVIEKIANSWDQPGTGGTTRSTLEHYIQVKVLNAFEEIVTTGSEGNIFIRLANYLTYLNKTSAGLDPKNQQQVRKILKDLGGLRWRNLDHTNISFIQIRLIALLQVMQEIKNATERKIEAERKGRTGQGDLFQKTNPPANPAAVRPGAHKIVDVGKTTTPVSKINFKTFLDIRKDIQRMYIICTQTSQLRQGDGIRDMAALRELAKDLISGGPSAIEYDKEWRMNVAAGEAGQKVTLKGVGWYWNQRIKGNLEKAFGRSATAKVQNEEKRRVEEAFRREVLEHADLKDIPDFEGSPSAKDKITEGIIDLAIGKKPSPNRGAIKKDVRSKNKTDKKARNVQKDLRDIAIKGDKVQAQLKRATATMAGIKSRRQKRQPKNETTDAVKIQTLINKRLQAEVRRNMGRPALINRTGRFSNSVELTSLKPTPLGFAGDYTYQLSPYETFENTGDRKWPTGYNPKPLIAKSIRNLAEQYTVQRFTILRRR